LQIALAVCERNAHYGSGVKNYHLDQMQVFKQLHIKDDKKMKATKKIINYPNKFTKWADLPEIVKGILKDRGKEFQYRITLSSINITTASCRLPNGIVITGIAFMNDEDTPSQDVGIRVATGRLEGSLSAISQMSSKSWVIKA
jgi:hypothetical protein